MLRSACGRCADWLRAASAGGVAVWASAGGSAAASPSATTDVARNLFMLRLLVGLGVLPLCCGLPVKRAVPPFRLRAVLATASGDGVDRNTHSIGGYIQTKTTRRV